MTWLCSLPAGVQEAVVICLNKQTREAVDQSLCVSSRRPPQLLQDCKTQPCPPRYSKTPHSDFVIVIIIIYTCLKWFVHGNESGLNNECSKNKEKMHFLGGEVWLHLRKSIN